MKRVNSFFKRKVTHAPKTDKVSVKMKVPPEMLRKEGVNVDKPVPVEVNFTLPKGVLPKEGER